MADLQPEEIEALPVMQAWNLATAAALEELGPEYVIRFLRHLADQLEANMVPMT